MSNERIRRGLEEMRATGSRSTANMASTGRLAAMAGLDVSLVSVKHLRATAMDLREQLAKLHSDIAKQDEAKTARITREHDELGWMADEKGRGRIDHLGATKRRQLRDAALKKMRKGLRETVAEKAETLLQKIRELEATRGYLREAWSTPLVYLNRITLMNAERATAQSVLNGAGAYTLNLAAAEAIRTGNRGLAAAVCAASENLPRSQRELMRYSREEIAASVGFNEFHDATEALEMARYELASAELDGRELIGVKVSPEERMAVGRIKADFLSSLEKPLEDSDGGDNGDD